jgi:tight adherence protein C
MVIGIAIASGAFLVHDSLMTTFSLVKNSWRRFAVSDVKTAQRVALGAAAFIGASLLSIVMRIRFPLSLMMCAAFVVISLMVQESEWKKQAKDLDFAIALTTPAWLDLCALTLHAGLPMRIALTQSLASASDEVQMAWSHLKDSTEKPLAQSLEDVARTAPDSVTSRVVGALLVSLERGTPIAEVLSALSSELRSENRRVLLEIAAKKDVTMMLPVVFGILPAVTAVALFPAFQTLTSLH